jgi:hypothetical protein
MTRRLTLVEQGPVTDPEELRELLLTTMAVMSGPRVAYEKLVREGRIEPDSTNVRSMTVLASRNRDRVPRKINDASDLIPWQLKTEHIHAHPAKMLRHISRMNKGEEIPYDAKKKARAFMSDLKQHNQVIHYSPALGFLRVPRRTRKSIAGIEIVIDEGWIRDPFIDDEGNKIGE